jgi:hypothetical protein
LAGQFVPTTLRALWHQISCSRYRLRTQGTILVRVCCLCRHWSLLVLLLRRRTDFVLADSG